LAPHAHNAADKVSGASGSSTSRAPRRQHCAVPGPDTSTSYVQVIRQKRGAWTLSPNRRKFQTHGVPAFRAGCLPWDWMWHAVSIWGIPQFGVNWMGKTPQDTPKPSSTNSRK
jgi:hypothetical protein